MGLLLIAACRGTEHAVFIPLQRSVAPAPAGMDATPEPADSGPSPGASDADTPDEDDDSGVTFDPDLDRTITFEWNETLPGQGTCREGSYVGSFECIVPEDPPAAEPTPLSGQVAFTLGSLSEQQVLSITEGSVADPIGIVFTAKLSGSLRCRDNEFEAYTENGMTIGFGTFMATLAGRYDPDALVIDGDFMMIGDNEQQCIGEFHVSAAP